MARKKKSPPTILLSSVVCCDLTNNKVQLFWNLDMRLFFSFFLQHLPVAPRFFSTQQVFSQKIAIKILQWIFRFSVKKKMPILMSYLDDKLSAANFVRASQKVIIRLADKKWNFFFVSSRGNVKNYWVSDFKLMKDFVSYHTCYSHICHLVSYYEFSDATSRLKNN